MNIIVAIFIGGGLGSLCRYGISLLLLQYSQNLPLSTLVCNALASLILGFIVWFIGPKLGAQHWLVMLLGVGFCGAFSTFSTFSLETLRLIQEGEWMYAVLNVLISTFLCLFILAIIYKSTNS